jgi:segregation and condensation protein A
MSHRLPITVRLDHFEGPLDLLLYLIQSHELDISKVSISHITDQYLGYVRLMQELNFDIASEFLVMAATLLLWKSKSLLPQEEKSEAGTDTEDGELSPQDLIRQLLEHQRFLAAGQDIAQLPRLHEDVFTRANKRPPIEKVWKEMDISSLALGYQDMLVKARKRKQVLRKETVSLADKIAEFADRLEVGRMTELTKLLSPLAERPEVVVTFLATLELSRLKRMRVHQEQTYGPILLELLESLKNFNAELASGFDHIVSNVEAELRDKTEMPALDVPVELLNPENSGSTLAPSAL